MTEPTYDYVKGQGWVLNAYETISGNIGKYRITLVKKAPNIGDFYFEETSPLETTLANLKDYWADVFQRERTQITMPVYKGERPWSSKTHFVTIYVEPL